MRRSGEATRGKILDAAEGLIYGHGFAGTSIDKVIVGAGVTKGAFFYHFKSKAELARAIIERYAERDISNFDATMARAESLAREPLPQVLIFVGLLREEAAELAEPAPGCLFASYVYERMEYPDGVADIVAHTLGHWRAGLAAKLRDAVSERAPSGSVDPEALADHLLAVFEGGYVVAKALSDPGQLVAGLEHYRRYLELLFGPASAAGTGPDDGLSRSEVHRERA